MSRELVRPVVEVQRVFGMSVTDCLLDLEARGKVLIHRQTADVNGAICDGAEVGADDLAYFRRPLGSLHRKTLLYPSQSALGGYAVNHMQGCRHGCQYPCYAMLMKRRFGQLRSYEEWIQPKTVANAESLLERELEHADPQVVGPVTLSLTSGPFMYGEPEVEKLSLRLIRALNRWGIPARVLTKGVLPQGLPTRAVGGAPNEYGVSLVSLNENFRRRFEPFAAPCRDRLASLRDLQRSGATTWVCMEPYPPPSVVRQDIGALLGAVSFVDRVHFGKWNYGGTKTRGEAYASTYSEAVRNVVEFCGRRGIVCTNGLA